MRDSISPIVMYPVGGYLIQISDGSSNGFSRQEIFEKPVFVSADSAEILKGVVSHEDVRKYGINASDGRYVVHREGSLTLLIRWRFFFIFGFLLRWRIRESVRYGSERASLFRLWAREDLLGTILSPRSSFKEYLKAVARYTFFEDYTFWEYNQESDVFVCLCSSRELKSDFIRRSENSTLNGVLDGSFSHQSRRAIRQNFIDFSDNDLPQLIRIKVETGANKGIGVLTLYSSRQEFSINEKTIVQIRRCIEAKYNEDLRGSQRELIRLNEMILDSAKTKEGIDVLLMKFVKEAAEAFCFEACSVFLLDKEKKGLLLVAQKDSFRDGVPEREVIYPLSLKNSLTLKVFSEKRPRWSYELSKDAENSRRFSEKTRLPPKNWIGVPIINSRSGEALGVIRFKNKYRFDGNELKSAHITNEDFKNIYSIVMHLDNYISFTSLLSATNRKSDELSRFVRIFMHEVKSPISTFSSAPEKIKDLLDGKGYPEGEKVFHYLDDIKAMGARLKFLTDCYSVEKILEAKNIQRLSFLADVFYPVVNITKHHHVMVSGAHFDAPHNYMHGIEIRSDKNFCGIVLNALIDNAVKYADEDSRVVKMYARPARGRYFEYVVENEGLGIGKDELESVFQMGARGRLAEKSGVPGYGIGLSLSRMLMREVGGDLVIESEINPFRVVMKIPLEV